uniref:CSON007178 protein n=1 Tax=Culicoides sonorensis TaxID=179676 RepID=A0A336MW62_CULSO
MLFDRSSPHVTVAPESALICVIFSGVLFKQNINNSPKFVSVLKIGFETGPYHIFKSASKCDIFFFDSNIGTSTIHFKRILHYKTSIFTTAAAGKSPYNSSGIPTTHDIITPGILWIIDSISMGEIW